MSSRTTTSLKVLDVTKRDITTLRVVNTLPYPLDDVISVRVDSAMIRVELDGKVIGAQIEPYIHNGEIDSETFRLVFRVHLQPLGISTYRLVFDVNQTSTQVVSIATSNPGNVTELDRIFNITQISVESFQISNGNISTVHNGVNGMMKSVKRGDRQEVDLRTAFSIYKSVGGAYEMNIMERQGADYYSKKPPSYFLVMKGAVQQSVHIFAEGLYNALTLKNVTGVIAEQLNYFFHIDVNHIHDGKTNSELAFSFGTNLSFPSFYSDSVGIQLLRRKAEIFFPMPTSAVLEDNNVRITVSSNVPHACRATRTGFEAIIERVIHTDDGHGLGAGVDAIADDNLPVDMRFTILLEDLLKDDPEHIRYTAHTKAGHVSVQSTIYPPILLNSSKDAAVARRFNIPNLACDLQLLSVRPLPNNKRLLTIFKHGIRENGAKAFFECEGGMDFERFLGLYLESMSVKKVQETDLAGMDETQPEFDVHGYTPPPLKPFKFLSLLLTM